MTGKNDAPVWDVGIELRKSADQVLRSKTGSLGTIRFDSLEAGSYQLCPYELDQEAWTMLGNEALPPGEAKSFGDAPWQAPAAVPEQQDLQYRVQQGECIGQLGARYGLKPETIWDYADNADLKKQRESLYVLAPGDSVVIPARRIQCAAASTGQRYHLRCNTVPEVLRFRFLLADEPRKNEPYLVEISGNIVPKDASTDSDGCIEEWTPPDARSARILFPVTGEAYAFQLGALNPLGNISGLKDRLRSLGYFDGPLDDEATDDFAEALSEFQYDAGLTPSGTLDDDTRTKLESGYGT